MRPAHGYLSVGDGTTENFQPPGSDWIYQIMVWKNAALKAGVYPGVYSKVGTSSTTKPIPIITKSKAVEYISLIAPSIKKAHAHAESAPSLFAGESGGGTVFFKAEDRFNNWLYFNLMTRMSGELPANVADEFWDELQRIAMAINAIFVVKPWHEYAKEAIKESLPSGTSMLLYAIAAFGIYHILTTRSR